MPSAEEIYQHWLDDVARALWNEDHALVAAAMSYPGDMATSDGTVTFDGPDMMIEASIAFRDYLRRMGAQAYHRICNSAGFDDDRQSRINGRHTTYILRGGTYVVPPFANRMTLVRQDNTWLGAGIRADVINSQCTILSPAHLRAAAIAAGTLQKDQSDA